MTPPPRELSFSKNSLKKLGEQLRSDSYTDDDLAILTEWRQLNGEELTNVRSTLRSFLNRNKLTDKTLVSQRIKRLPTIIDKLNRFPKMSLARMQDIAGIRIVCDDEVSLSQLRKSLSKSKLGFTLTKDYLVNPSPDGYRGLHYIKQLKSGVLVELQIRTELQHAWATAVEISDLLYTHEGELKTNKSLNSTRSRFFQIISSFMAIEEFTIPILHGHEFDSHAQELLEELVNIENQSQITKTISRYSPAFDTILKYPNFSHCILALNNQGISIKFFSAKDLEKAIQYYADLEKQKETYSNVVLISMSSLKSLKKAYPNYFGGTQQFTSFILKLVNSSKS